MKPEYRQARIPFAVALAWLLMTATSPAVIVFQKGEPEPIRAYLVEESASQLIVDQLLPNGETVRREIPRSSIDQLLETVSPERLAALQPDDPRAYRDYADELSEKRQDPDARRTAERLYLIAAYLDPGELGRGCLLAMADLALTDAQRRRYRAMVYLLDAAHDRSVLNRSGPASPRLEDRHKQQLLRGLHALRSGRKTVAARIAAGEDFQKSLGLYPEFLTLDEFTAAAAELGVDLPRELLRRVLNLELTLLDAPPEHAPAGAGSSSWSSISIRRSSPVAELKLEAVAPFDPRLCLFRNGQWVAP